jgi:endo-1,4-beta-xylanase
VTFWGLTDQLSWRSTHNPLIFNSDFSEKLGAAAVADPEGWLDLRKPITDTSTLEETIAQAKALDLRGHTYTGKSLAAVKKALGGANAALAKGAPQAKVNEATAALVAAVAALERKEPHRPRK